MKKTIKNNLPFIIFLIVLYFLLSFKLPYYIDTSGGLIDLKDRYKIDNEYKIKGSINMTYVSEYRATPITFIMSKFNNNLDLYKRNDVMPSNVTEDEYNFYGEKSLKEGSDNAIITAYKKALKKYKIINDKEYVTYIFEDAKTNLKIKDQIIKIDGITINKKKDIYDIIKDKNVNDKINLTVINNKVEYNRYAYILDGKIIGIIVSSDRKIETYPKIKSNFEDNEYGSSGGLLTTLSIYSKLLDYDITGGKKISGTGTIDEEGNVGKIDGVKYKLKGAVKEKADVFFAPSGDNYKEAIKIKNKYNYKIDVVEVKTFDDLVEYLKKRN